MGVVPGQFHSVGDLAEGGFDAVAPLGDGLEQGGQRDGALFLIGRDEDSGAAGGLGGGEARPEKPLSASRSRGAGPASRRSVATSRSLTAAGTIAHARTMRLLRSVLMARRKP